MSNETTYKERLEKSRRNEFKTKVSTYCNEEQTEFVMQMYDEKQYDTIVTYLKNMAKYGKVNGLASQEICEKTEFKKMLDKYSY